MLKCFYWGKTVSQLLIHSCKICESYFSEFSLFTLKMWVSANLEYSIQNKYILKSVMDNND